MTQKKLAAWSAPEQKILYRGIRRLIGQSVSLPCRPSPLGINQYTWEEGPLTMDWVYADALNMRARRFGSEDNFRAGRMSREKAAILFKWLQDRFPEEARVVENEIARLYGTVTQSEWEQLIRESGVFGGVKLAHTPAVQSTVRALTAEERAERALVSVTVPLNRPFRFSIDNTKEFLVGFQWVAGKWTALPLSESGLGCRLNEPQSRAYLENAHFIEDAEAGLHRFVFVEMQAHDGHKAEALFARDVVLTQRILNELARVLRDLDATTWTMHRLNAMFVPTSDGWSLP